MFDVIIAPPMPAMYNRPQAIDEIVNYTFGRLLDQFDIGLSGARSFFVSKMKVKNKRTLELSLIAATCPPR